MIMKLKDTSVEKEGMNKELYNLFIEMIKLEYNKSQFLKGAKFYCWAHGLDDYCRFFKFMMEECGKCKNDFIFYLLGRFEDIPEIKIDSIKTDYKDAEEVFLDFVKVEETFIGLLEQIVLKSKEINDANAMAFAIPILNKVDHIACRALEAVRANKNPFDLVRGRADMFDF